MSRANAHSLGPLQRFVNKEHCRKTSQCEITGRTRTQAEAGIRVHARWGCDEPGERGRGVFRRREDIALRGPLRNHLHKISALIKAGPVRASLRPIADNGAELGRGWGEREAKRRRVGTKGTRNEGQETSLSSFPRFFVILTSRGQEPVPPSRSREAAAQRRATTLAQGGIGSALSAY